VYFITNSCRHFRNSRKCFINSRKPRVRHGDFNGPRVFMKQTVMKQTLMKQTLMKQTLMKQSLKTKIWR